MAVRGRLLPRIQRLFYKGASYSVDAELLGIQSDGEYIDAVNMRPNGVSADYSALPRIRGEVIQYPSVDNSCNTWYGTPSTFPSGNWRCMLAVMVKGNAVEFWADQNEVLDPFIRINGVIVAANPALPISIRFPPQAHWNHNCLQGEIYYSDHNTAPVIWMVQDLIDNGITHCNETYFSEFDLSKYQVNLNIPPHKMKFWELTNSPSYPADAVFGIGGLAVGMYCYTFRCVDDTGNRTNVVPTTPLIPVPVSLDYRDARYPGIKTYGAEPATPSPYGIVLKFRVENVVGYSYIEVIRYAYNQGSPIGFTPTGFVIGRVQIVPQEVSIKTVVDLGEIGEPLAIEEDGAVLGSILKCKSLRYFENVLTLHNVTYQQLNVDNITFLDKGGEVMFPVIDRIGKIGYDDSWNTAYRKSYRRGEIYGFGVGFYGGQMEHSFVKKVPGFNSYQFPERRDEATANTITYSYNGLPRAVVYQTNDDALCYETYDLDEAVPKEICCDGINISCDGSKGDAGLCNGDCGVNELPESCGSCEVDTPYQGADIGYNPMNPTWDGDGDVTEHNYRVNLKVCNACNAGSCSGTTEYNPVGFAPRYYALGMALAGITNIPNGVQAFTVVRTPKAGRVVASGIGMYYLMPGNAPGTPGTKSPDRFWFYSSEAVPWVGLMTPGTVNSINQNAGNRYRAQLVSPVGIFTEMPWGFNRDIAKEIVDICVYPRFYKDTGTINVSPDPVTGNGAGYVQFGKWRNDNFPAWVANLYGNPLSVSKAAFNINLFRDANNNGTPGSGFGSEFVGDRGGQYMVLGTDEAVYSSTGVGLNDCDNSYESVDTKNFHEPMYNINIVDTAAGIPQTDVMTFLDTGAYTKRHALIGVGDGAQTTYLLIDENWYDCRPWSANTYANIAGVDANVINSLIFIEQPSGVILTLLNADGISNATLAGMVTPFTIDPTALSKPGITIDGFYRTTAQAINGLDRFYSVVFDAGFTPAIGDKIYVDYDEEVPRLAFGGDSYIGDDVFSPVDRKKSNNHNDGPFQGISPTEASLFLDIGFPYLRMEINPRILIVNRADTNMNIIQDCCRMSMSYIRQMASLFNCESVIHLPYNHEGGKLSDFQSKWFFPATNYIQRPISWDTDDPANTNFCGGDGNIFDAYKDDYPGEYNVWRYGGYRTQPRINTDYLHVNNIESWVTKPIGYVEQNEYCTRIIWSLRRDTGKQDVPSLKTFLPQNYYDLEDSQGEIKFAWSTDAVGTGNNLYSICDRGICLAITNKSVLRDADSEFVGMQKAVIGDFVTSEDWKSRTIGMNAEMWRTKAEYDNRLWFANLQSVYEFDGATLKSIMDNKYQARLLPWLMGTTGNYFSPGGSDGNWFSAVYDTKHREYVLQLQIGQNFEEYQQQTFAYNVITEQWNGRYGFLFDQYLSFDNKTYGMGRFYDGPFNSLASTYLLDEGNTINNAVIICEVLTAFTPSPISMDYEFVDFRLASTQAPDMISFYNDVMEYNNNQPQCQVLGSDMLNRNAWEQYIPRKNPVFAGDDNRFQGRTIVCGIVYSGIQDFVIHNMSISYKALLVNGK